MSARIRGHYRIDSVGRIEPVSDVNGAAMKFQAARAALPPQQSARLIRLCISGFVLMVLGVGSMLALPKIQRALISAEAAQFASVRHMHGHHMHEMANRLLRRDVRDERGNPSPS